MQITASDAPALPKPSLLARKDIRDEFDAHLPEINKTINELLKDTSYKVEINFPQLFADCIAIDQSAGNRVGSTAKLYVDGFIDNLKKYTDKGEFDDAIQTFNDLVVERKIVIASDDKISYEGCSIKNGIFEINYGPKAFGTNSSYACYNMAKEIDKALFVKTPYVLPVLLRKGIRDEWTSQKETVTRDIKEELLGADVKLLADVEGIWKLMVDAKNSKQDIDLTNIAPSFGNYLYQYFNGFLFQIKYQFKKDDLMVEGFTEAVPTGEIWVEVVPKEQLKEYNECKIEEGKVILRTTPANWGTNASYVADKLSNLL